MKKPTPVSDLLAQGQGVLQRLRQGAEEAERTLAALRRHLPPALAGQVAGAVVRDGTLTVVVRSAAWGARLRYQAASFREALAEELAVTIDRVTVKIRSGRP